MGTYFSILPAITTSYMKLLIYYYLGFNVVSLIKLTLLLLLLLLLLLSLRESKHEKSLITEAI
jgi:hypothetical protein